MDKGGLISVAACCLLAVLFYAFPAHARLLDGAVTVVSGEGTGAKTLLKYIGGIAFLLAVGAYFLGRGNLARAGGIAIGAITAGYIYDEIVS